MPNQNPVPSTFRSNSTEHVHRRERGACQKLLLGDGLQIICATEKFATSRALELASTIGMEFDSGRGLQPKGLIRFAKSI